MKVTPDTKLKKPMDLLLKGKPVKLFHHEKGSSYCVVEFPNGESKVAALCDLELVGKAKKPLPKKVKPVDEYKDFYASLWVKEHFNCQSCKKPLYAFNKAAKRAVSAHILPKSVFKSVATDPDNIVFMGVEIFGSSCRCHDIFDTSVEKRVKMPVYDIVLKRYHEKLKHKLTPKEQYAAEEYLGIVTKHTNLAKELIDNK